MKDEWLVGESKSNGAAGSERPNMRWESDSPIQTTVYRANGWPKVI